MGDEEVGQWWGFFSVLSEGEVLAVFEVAAGGDDGEVAVVVAGGVAEVGAREDGGLVEEGVVAFFDFIEAGHEFGEEAHFLEFDEGELFDLLFVAPVVAEVVPVFIDSF